MKQMYGSVYSCERGNRWMAEFGGEWGLGRWQGEVKGRGERARERWSEMARGEGTLKD